MGELIRKRQEGEAGVREPGWDCGEGGHGRGERSLPSGERGAGLMGVDEDGSCLLGFWCFV